MEYVSSFNLNSSASFNDRVVEYIKSNEEWIKKSLGINSLQEAVRVNTMDWFVPLMRVIVKKMYFNTNDKIDLGVSSSLVDELSAMIEYATDASDIGNTIIQMATSLKNDTAAVTASIYAITLKLRALSAPFVAYSTLVACGGHQDSVSELLIRKDYLDEFVSFVKDIEHKSRRIVVNAQGQRPYNVSPIDWDDIVLDESIRFMIKNDLDSFLKKRKWFEQKGLPYRRGYLLYGPPGNGKSTAIRAMLTHAKIPAYTLKRMYDDDAPYYFEEMFETASSQGNAIIIMEDLDRCLSTKGTPNKDSETCRIPMSLFLNCLDGVAEADGIIVVATANSPQVLDSAILQRPGRFDRVVQFPNPSPENREKYFKKLLEKISIDTFPELVKASNDMSFAQLREIYILGSQLAEQNGKENAEISDLVDACNKVKEYNAKVLGSAKTGFK